MLYNTSKSVIDAISKIVSEDRKKYNEERDSFESKLQLEAMKKMKYEYIVPEDIEKEGVAHFMGAAAAAHKAGQKKFNFGGKVYPVQIKPHIAHQVNSESVNPEADQIDEISKKTLGSYISRASVDMANRSADGERKRTLAGADFAHNISRGMDYKKAEAGMMKDREAAKPDVKKSVQRMRGIDKAVGRLAKEEVEELDELSKSTLASYAKKSSNDARMSGQIAKDFENKSTSYRKPEMKSAAARLSGEYKKRAWKREDGTMKAIDRLAKEEVEQIDEYSGLQKLARKIIPGQGQKQAGERAKDQGYSAALDREALKYHPDDKKLATTMKSSEKAQQRYKRISRGEAPFKSSPNDNKMREEKDTPGNSYEHQCALHVKSEQFGEGKTLFSQHAEPDENGSIAWYDVMFEHGIEKQVPTSELEILISEAHTNHSKKRMKEEVELEEGRGRPRKSSTMMKKSDDEDDDYGPDTGPEPDQNIVNHLKKSVDTGGTHDVKFGDGSSHKVPSQVAHKVLGAMGKLKPSDRLEIQKHIHASHKNLMDVHRMIK